MASYEKKPEVIDAWQVGSNPIPDWVKNLPADKLARKETPDGRKYAVVYTPAKLIAESGDYVLMDDADVLSTMSRAEFERRWRRTGNGRP